MTIAPAPSDAALVARLRSRDRTAWEDVYSLYGDRLYKFAYHLTGNPHDSADLVQETFVRVLPKLDSLDPETLDLGAYHRREIGIVLRQNGHLRPLDRFGAAHPLLPS